jgi:DNA-binding GntR family transcriptional regulator
MQSIQRRTLAEVAANLLRDRILRGDFTAGEPLRQEPLAAELGVSRIPLREAFQRLEAEGLIILSPHRGAVVADLPIAAMPEIFELRALVECDLLARAVPHVSRAHHAAARAARLDFESAVAGADIARLGATNLAFHLALYAPAERQRTGLVVERLHQECDRLLRLQLTLTQGGAQAIAEHRELHRAWRDGDVSGAVLLLHLHITGASHRLAGALASSTPTERV